MSQTLTISPIPFQSSKLSIPTTPFSPQLPLSPPTTPPTKPLLSLPAPKPIDVFPPPPRPLAWLWQCHICHRTYRLGATRLCLDDGHAFCAGTTLVWRRGRKQPSVKRHKACASEFDYAGWKRWSEWKERLRCVNEVEARALKECVDPLFEEDGEEFVEVTFKQSEVDEVKEVKDCWNKCTYPSECRWKKKMVRTPPATAAAPPPTSFEEMDVDLGGTDAAADLVDSEDVAMADEPECDDTNELQRCSSPKSNAETLLATILAGTKARKDKTRSSKFTENLETPCPPFLQNTVSTTTPEQKVSAVSGTEGKNQTSAPSTLSKAIGDLELDLSKGLEKANSYLSVLAEQWRARSPSPGRKRGGKEEGDGAGDERNDGGGGGGGGEEKGDVQSGARGRGRRRS